MTTDTNNAGKAKHHRRQQPPRVFSVAEAEAILAKARYKSFTGLRNRVIMETMYRAGLRVSEIISLRADQVKLCNGDSRLEIRHSKRDRGRNVPVGPKLRGWMEQWSAMRRQDSPLFFHVLSGGPLRQNYICEMVKTFAVQAGLPAAGASPHVFRHTFATEALDAGFTLPEVQALLGHSSLATTAIYLHVKPQQLADKMAGFG